VNIEVDIHPTTLSLADYLDLESAQQLLARAAAVAGVRPVLAGTARSIAFALSAPC